MAEHSVTRKLLAILAADMVGYSRLMEADETGTIERQKTHRAELIDPKIAEHHGRIVKTTGDGLLVEFASVVDAVACAVEVQRAMGEREADVPEERRIRYRVGINLGDIVIDEDDIYGDGVNIAARLQELTEPGGVSVSGTAYEHLKAKVEVGYEYLGEQRVKNIEKPVPVYRALLDPKDAGKVIGIRRHGLRPWMAAAAAAGLVALVAAGGLVIWQPWSPDVTHEPSATSTPQETFSIVVLPFDSFSDDPNDDYLADGITEDLITDLSRIRGAFVIARGTSFTYRDKVVSATDVAKELNVHYVLEGSVRRTADQVRINAQLSDGETGAHVWSDRFDREFKDVFSLQNEITGRIAAVLKLELLDAESRRLQAGPPDNLEAWDYALHAWATLITKPITEERTLEAQQLLHKALELDPNSALAWTAMARVHALGTTSGWGTTSKDLSRRLMLEAAKKAVALDPKSADAHRELGFAYRFHREIDLAVSACETALALNPNHHQAYQCLANAKVASGQPAEAIPLFESSVRLNPREGRPARRNFFIGWAYLMAGDYEEAAGSVRQGISANPEYPPQYWVLASALGHLGREQEARAALAEFNRVDKGRRDSIGKMRKQYDYVVNFDHALEGLRRAGMPEE
jgi:TolB-like protein/class 3 adenylate cyclase/Tfp pilus assembly protein PilF